MTDPRVRAVEIDELVVHGHGGPPAQLAAAISAHLLLAFGRHSELANAATALTTTTGQAVARAIEEQRR